MVTTQFAKKLTEQLLSLRSSIVVRYFLSESGVKVKLLEFESVSGETAEILSECLLSVLDQTKLKDKLIEFCADNCNTNFGGVYRRGHNNVFHKVKILRITLNETDKFYLLRGRLLGNHNDFHWQLGSQINHQPCSYKAARVIRCTELDSAVSSF